MFDGRWRTSIERGLEPVGTGLRRTGLTANHLTASGLILAGAAAVTIGSGRLVLGLVLLVASALPDLLDGAVAKAAGTASPRGAFFDSVADRVSDSLVLGAVAWHLARVRPGPTAVLALAVLAASMLVSYERARAESLGFHARGGLMERAERITALSFGLAFGLLVPVLWLMLVLILATATHRFVMVWRQASAPLRPERPERPVGRWRWRPASHVGAESEWRRWRERRAARPRASVGTSTAAAWRRRRPRTRP